MAKDKEVEEANNNVNSQYAKVATMSKELQQCLKKIL